MAKDRLRTSQTTFVPNLAPLSDRLPTRLKGR